MTEAATPPVLVVVPCLNEEGTLPGLLTQLVSDGGFRRLVVADGQSGDCSREIVSDFSARFPQVVMIDNPARVQSAGVNLAVRTLGGDCEWLIRVDAHCRYPSRYVRGLLATAVDRGCDSVVVPMTTCGEGGFQRAVAAAQNSVLGTGGSPHRRVGMGRFVEHGHHAAMRLELFRRVGGYDEGFSHNEDAELDQRLLAEGARIWLEPALAIVYAPRRSARELFRQYRAYGHGRARTAMRHRNPIALRQLLPLVIAPMVALAVLGILGFLASPWLGLLALPAIGWVVACVALGGVLALRQRSVSVLASGVAAAIMHLAWSIGNWQARMTGDPPGPLPEPMQSGAHPAPGVEDAGPDGRHQAMVGTILQ